MLNIIKLAQKYIFSGNPARTFPFSSNFFKIMSCCEGKQHPFSERHSAETGNGDALFARLRL